MPISFLKEKSDGSYGLNYKLITKIGLAFIALIVFFNTVGTVGAGERGVRLRFGAVVGTVDQGLFVKIPFVERVIVMDVKIQKVEVEASAASSDLQTVTSKVALNYHLEPNLVSDVYQRIGINFIERLVKPALQESVKSSTAKFTAEQLITQREFVRETIKITLRAKLENTGIIVDEFNIVDFDFSRAFNDAIEAKVTAEQNALGAKNKLEQIKYEAEQATASAKGKAEAQRIEGEALKANPEVLQLRAIEQWKGEMPTYWGGQALPFINIK